MFVNTIIMCFSVYNKATKYRFGKCATDYTVNNNNETKRISSINTIVNL